MKGDRLCGGALYLRVLQREDEHVNAVEEFARNCAVTWSSGSQWLPLEETSTEGMLLLVRRGPAPRHRLVVLNRKTPENLWLSVDEIEVARLDPAPQKGARDSMSITLQMRGGRSYCFYFQNGQEAQEMHAAIQRAQGLEPSAAK